MKFSVILLFFILFIAGLAQSQNTQNFDIGTTEDEFIKYFKSHIKSLDPLEGIWVRAMKTQTYDHGNYEATKESEQLCVCVWFENKFKWFQMGNGVCTFILKENHIYSKSPEKGRYLITIRRITEDDLTKSFYLYGDDFHFDWQFEASRPDMGYDKNYVISEEWHRLYPKENERQLLIENATNRMENCSLSNFFTFKHGITKFQAYNILNNDKRFDKITLAWGKKFPTYEHYKKPAYFINNDSVYIVQLDFKFTEFPCLNASDNYCILDFADDRLYHIYISCTIPLDEYTSLINVYTQMINKVKVIFPYSTPFVLKNQDSSEQCGEGFWFFKSKEESQKRKIERIAVQYSANYESIYENGKFKWTNKIESYEFELSWANYKGTKLDIRENLK